MSIYTSEKVMLYVYMCIHKETGHFYIGSRTTNKQTLPSHLDFPLYKTSSKLVKPQFDFFNWVIIAEFFDPVSAYLCEQQLIFENWENHLLLNRVCHHNKRRWSTSGMTRTHSSASKLKMSIARSGANNHMFNKHHSPETKTKISKAKSGRGGHKHSAEHKHRMSTIMTGRTLSPETKAKISAAAKARVPVQNKTPRKDARRWKIYTPDGEIVFTNNLQKTMISVYGFTKTQYDYLYQRSKKNKEIATGPLKGWRVELLPFSDDRLC